MANLKPIDVAAFWSRVEGSTPFQCWPWTGQKNDKGYGRFRGTMAHRIAYELINGSIPEGEIVRHRCDNPPCCNPDHLLSGSHSDNTRDAVERGRLAYGERCGHTKLTAQQVAYIRRNPHKRKQADIAREFGVSESTVSYIRNGRSWKMVGAVGFEPTTSAVSRRRSPAELSALGMDMPIAEADAPRKTGT